MKRYKGTLDWILLGIVVVLLVVAMTVLYSATYKSQALGLAEFYWARQIIWLGIGFILLFSLAYIDYRQLGMISWIFYAVGLGSLLAVLLFGPTISGSQRWLHFGPMTLQPSEFMKVIYIISLAWYLDAVCNESFSWKHMIFSGLMTIPPVVLIAFEPDLGTALVFVPIYMGMIFVAGAPLRYLFALGGMGLMMAPVMWFIILKPYQKRRIFMFLNPQNDQFGSGWTILQSRIAIGSGRWSGKGMMKGSQTQLDFLPEHYTDFIFSVLAEEWGFLGVLVLFALFFALITRALMVAQNTYDTFGRCMVTGIMILLAFQMLINIGMTFGAFPVTGLPLPFLSYGGSALITSLVGVGLILSVHRYRD